MELKTQQTNNKGWTINYNLLIDNYAKILGPYALSIYQVLNRYFNKEEGLSWPSNKLISKKLNISSRSVVRHIKILVEYNLIRVHKVSTSGRWSHNEYKLTNPRFWKQPSDSVSPGQHPNFDPPGDTQTSGPVTDSHTIKTKYINNTNNLERINPNKFSYYNSNIRKRLGMREIKN